MDFQERLEKVIEFVKVYGSITNKEGQALTGAHRNTITEDFRRLIDKDILSSSGTGKGTRYFLKEAIVFSEEELKKIFDKNQKTKIDKYLQKRNRSRIFFNKTINQALSSDFSFPTEVEDKFTKLKIKIREKKNKLSNEERKRKKERLIIDLSWASSHIEGNTYSLLETETLIKYNETPQGKSFLEAKMILNHKSSLDYIRSSETYYKRLSKTKILELHQILIDELNINTGFREHLVKITNSSYVPCDNKFQIISYFDIIVDKINGCKSILEKAIISNLLIAYLQPFADGNKRTSRMLGNAVLIANEYLPISFSHTPKEEYIKSLLYFYEKQDPVYFKYLFLKELNNSFIEYIG